MELILPDLHCSIASDAVDPHDKWLEVSTAMPRLCSSEASKSMPGENTLAKPRIKKTFCPAAWARLGKSNAADKASAAVSRSNEFLTGKARWFLLQMHICKSRGVVKSLDRDPAVHIETGAELRYFCRS